MRRLGLALACFVTAAAGSVVTGMGLALPTPLNWFGYMSAVTVLFLIGAGSYFLKM